MRYCDLHSDDGHNGDNYLACGETADYVVAEFGNRGMHHKHHLCAGHILQRLDDGNTYLVRRYHE